MKQKKGRPLPLGVSDKDGYVNFAIAVPADKNCILKLYKKDNKLPCYEVPLMEEDAVGVVRCVALPKAEVKCLEYTYEINGECMIDPYARAIVEKEDCSRGKVVLPNYNWGDDRPLELPYDKVIAYNLHVRGFTKHRYSKVKHKGTFQGVIEKIPYLLELGVNQIQCMPVYHFEDSERYDNYWGYGDAYCLAMKNKYAATQSPEKEMKDMVKACHKAGIEVVLNLPFSNKIPKSFFIECLRYYVMEYHIDGFILNPYIAPVDSILSDPLLSKTKILCNKDDFQDVMRRFLKGEAGMIQGLMWWLKQQAITSGSCNYITNHTGFTLADLVSYDEKHNEANGEHNQDGPDYNHSWNCGTEGKTRKKAVLELRQKQVRNAFFLLLTAQGTPSILAGDEFGNSQQGNNNVYCQDNEIAWLNWKDMDKQQKLVSYVKRLIQLRKELPILHAPTPLLGVDKTGCGVPDVSYHGVNAWQAPDGPNSKQLGVYYHSKAEKISDCFTAYNMDDAEYTFALPNLPKGKSWYLVLSTDDYQTKEKKMDDKSVTLSARTGALFVGR